MASFHMLKLDYTSGEIYERLQVKATFTTTREGEEVESDEFEVLTDEFYIKAEFNARCSSENVCETLDGSEENKMCNSYCREPSYWDLLPRPRNYQCLIKRCCDYMGSALVD